ncbi:MAG: hypothetical protein M1840_009139 [Geoglossum simile]|nr:MAG: hypothetical protein M1840_009139 [Geoglossum simile]
MSYHYLDNSDNDCARPGVSCRGICDPYLDPSLPFFAIRNLDPTAPLDFAPGSRAVPNPDSLTHPLFGDGTEYHPITFRSSDDGNPSNDYYGTQDWEMPYPWATALATLAQDNPNEGYSVQQQNNVGYNSIKVPEAGSYEGGYSTQRCYPASHNGNDTSQANSIEGGYPMQQFNPADHGDIEASQADPYEGRYSMQPYYHAGRIEDPQANSNEEHSRQQYHPAGHSAPETAFEEPQCHTFPPKLQPTCQYPTHSLPDDNLALPELARNTYTLSYVPTLPPIFHRSPNSDTSSPPEPPSDRSSSPAVTPLQRRHQQHHRQRHICPYFPCGNHFKRRSDLARHVKSLHSRPPVEELHKCKIEGCNRGGQGGYARKDKLLYHTKTRHGGEGL